MPSRRLQNSQTSPAPRSRRRRLLRLLALIVALVAAGCVSTSAPPSGGVAIPADDLAFLVDPTMGFVPTLSDVQHREVAAGASALRRGDIAGATATASTLRDSAPGVAAVLQAEIDLVRGNDGAASERLEPVLQAMPDYIAAQIVRGRVQERLGDLVGAYGLYAAVGDQFAPAARRAAELRSRVVEILGQRVSLSLDAGRTAAASESLHHLQAWAPAEEVTLRSALAVARAVQDPRAELSALRSLASRHPEDEALARRRARLELHWGDPTVGFEILQHLSAEHPEDATLANDVAGARYYWRLAMLPTGVRDLTRRPSLTRAEYAGLLYWLMPSVRSQPGASRIASDVLDSPWRTEIIRVVNLGLMDIDRSQHRFEPKRPVTQREALLALVRLIGRHLPAPACLGGIGLDDVDNAETVCGAAAACKLLVSRESCLPTAPVSGQEAVEYAHQALQSVGGS